MAEAISTDCKPQGIRTARKDYTFLPPPHSQLAQFSYTKTVSSTSRQDAPRDADFSAHIRRAETASDGIPIQRNITYPRQSAVIIRGTAISSLTFRGQPHITAIRPRHFAASPRITETFSRQPATSPLNAAPPDNLRQDFAGCKAFRTEGGPPPWQTAEKRCRTVDFPREKIGRRT